MSKAACFNFTAQKRIARATQTTISFNPPSARPSTPPHQAVSPGNLSFDREGDDSWALLFEIEMLCKLIADLKLDGVRESLAEIRSIEDLWVSAYVNGALAAVGDQQATATLHRLARDGKSAERVFAVEMCRYLTDEESARIIQEAVTAKQRDVRNAATKQLTRFKDRRSP